jgi:prepilin-type N-terminal cleavage/methylation domain-containing protein
MYRSGFTLVEVIIVLFVVGLVATIGLPKVSTMRDRANVRGARAGFGNLAVKARGAAVQRGCTASLNFTTGTTGRVWVTVCRLGAAGTDTVGTVEPLASRFGVSMSSSSASPVQFNPRGMSIGFQATKVVFTSTTGGYKDSTMLNQVGKVVR